MAEDRVDAVRADVRWEANTGEVKADTRDLQRQFHESYGAMSADTLQVALAQQRFEKALVKSGAQSTQAKTAYIALQRAIEQTTASTNQHAAAVDRDRRELAQWVRGAVAGSGAARSLGRNVAYASSTFLGGAGLISALASTLRVAGQYQRAMAILAQVTGGTAKQMQVASRVAKDLGRDIRLPNTSAKDAAEAMTELAKAGLSLEQSIAAARGTLQLGAAATISVAQAAKITGGALNAFGLDGARTGEIVDALANAANAASGEIPDMALALAQASTVAKRTGLSVQETVTALSVLAKNAILGSDAGTSLRVMLTRFIPVSAAASKEMDRLGLTAFTSTGQFKPFRQIIEEYHDALVKLTPKQRASALQIIFGQDAQRAANILLVEGVKSYDRLTTAVNKQGGAARQAQARNSGYVGALDAFKSSVETLQISLGTKLLPTFTETIRNLTEWVNRVDASGKGTDELVGVIEDGVETAANLGKEFLHLVETIDRVTSVVGGLGNAFEIALVIGLIVKIRRAAESFGLITSSSAVARTKVVADAQAMGAALDAATRPRTVQVNVVQTGVPGTGGTGLPPVVTTPGGTTTTGGGRTTPPAVQIPMNPGKPGPIANPTNALPGGLLSGLVLYGGFTAAGAGASQPGRLEPRLAYDTTSGSYFLEYLYKGKVVQRRKVSEADARKANPKFVAEVKKATSSAAAFDFASVGERKIITSAVQGSIGAAGPGAGGPVLPDENGPGATRTDATYRIELLNATSPTARRTIEQRRLDYIQGQVSKLSTLQAKNSPKFLQLGGEKRLANLLQERNSLRDDIKQINEQLTAEEEKQAQDAFAAALARLENRRQAAIATENTIKDDLRVNDDLLATLRGQLSKEKKGTAEYEQIRGQIDAAERDREDILKQPAIRAEAFRFAELERRRQAAEATAPITDDLGVNADLIAALKERVAKEKRGTEEWSKAKADLDAARRARTELLAPSPADRADVAAARIERERAAAERTPGIRDNLKANADDLAEQRRLLADAERGTADFVKIQARIDALLDDRLQIQAGGRRAGDALRLQKLDLRLYIAEGTKTLADNRAALRAQIRELRALSHDADYSESEQLDFVKRRIEAERALKGLTGTPTEKSLDTARVIAQLAEEQRQIVATYAPNFLVQAAAATPAAPPKTTNLYQTNQFTSPTADPWLAARIAGFSLKAEFDG